MTWYLICSQQVMPVIIFPTDIHWLASKRLLRYLKGIIHFALTLNKSTTLDIITYYNVDYANNPYDHHKTGSYCVFLSEWLIYYDSFK